MPVSLSLYFSPGGLPSHHVHPSSPVSPIVVQQQHPLSAVTSLGWGSAWLSLLTGVFPGCPASCLRRELPRRVRLPGHQWLCFAFLLRDGNWCRPSTTQPFYAGPFILEVKAFERKHIKTTKVSTRGLINLPGITPPPHLPKGSGLRQSFQPFPKVRSSLEEPVSSYLSSGGLGKWREWEITSRKTKEPGVFDGM